MFKKDIPLLEKCTSFKKMDEGFSEDEKWCVDEIYLLRISPNIDLKKLEMQKELINAVHVIDSHIPFVHEVGVYKDKSYMILDYINGENGEVVLPNKSEVTQYEIGVQVGGTLKNMHSIPAPLDYPSWEETWNTRIENHAQLFEDIVRRNPSYQCILSFILENLHLLRNRPSNVQHYDFHPGNILIDEDRFTGLIDMQKIRYADPINEFYKMEYFNVQLSKPYACGVVDGYHNQEEIPSSFWELHKLYAAMHIVFAEVWGHEVAINQLEKFQGYTRFTLEQFDNFKLDVPKWYTKPSYILP
ncbi:aminoglycoside phosphotransferase family protein [Psychrobacillus sp. FJAT-51614]|uniref:Aminoglycoside phosphotransferase family protein n=1 Tax=Psychrobacillus mangrovi TaxID=3117745 RepID=A0ABU8EZI6_9BACI